MGLTYKASAGSKYSVILPTYNERENLPIIIQMLATTFLTHDLQWEVVIVEDNSPDKTLEVAQSLQKIFTAEKIQILSRKGKLGLGSAYMEGLKLVTGNFVILMDADLSHHPKFIPDFIAEQRKWNYDVVTGTRYLPGGGVYGWNFKRKIISRGANCLAEFFLAPGLSDLTGSFRLYKREVLEEVMQEMTSFGYVFQMEIAVRLKSMGKTVGEVPITFVDRIYGSSKMGPMEIFRYLQGLFSLWLTV